MAGNSELVHTDEENQYGGCRVQPFSIPSEYSRADIDQNDSETKKTTFGNLLGERLGTAELLSSKLWGAAVAELLGTAVLVFVIDTIVISTLESDIKLPNLLIAFLVFLCVTILLLATAPVSGGHINPVVTFAAGLLGLISPCRSVVYILAQCTGGVVGALALEAVVGDTIESTFSLGACTLEVIAPGPNGPISVGIGTKEGLWLEIICTFVFLYGSIWIAFDSRQAKAHGPLAVCSIVGAILGLMVFVSLTVTTKKGYAGAGMNPARCVGPVIVRGGHLWNRHWVFWVGPAIACVAFYLYTRVIPSQLFHAHDFNYDFFTTLRTLSLHYSRN